LPKQTAAEDYKNFRRQLFFCSFSAVGVFGVSNVLGDRREQADERSEA